MSKSLANLVGVLVGISAFGVPVDEFPAHAEPAAVQQLPRELRMECQRTASSSSTARYRIQACTDILQRELGDRDRDWQWRALQARAGHYAVQGDNVRALADFDEAIRITSDSARFSFSELISSYQKRGEYHERIGDRSRAIADFSEAIQVFLNQEANYPRTTTYLDAVTVFQARAELYSRLGDRTRAIADYSEIVRLYPDHEYSARFNRAKLYEALGQNSRALADYSEVIRRAPSLTDAYTGRARVHDRMGNATGAAADRAEAVRSARRNDACRENQGAYCELRAR